MPETDDFATTRPTASALWSSGERDPGLLDAALIADRAAAAAAAAAPPATEPAATPTQDTGIVASRAQEAAAAMARSRERAGLVASARELLREQFDGAGIDVDDLSDQDVLELSGVQPSAEMLAAAEEQRVMSDPAAFAEHERTRSLKNLDSRWWGLSNQDRKNECVRLGIDFDATREAKLKEMRDNTYKGNS